MAFHYIIDGYNLLYAFPEMPTGTWQDKRETLLRFLQTARPQGKNRCTVVFDSRQGLGDKYQTGELTVIFTQSETADDRISRIVRELGNANNVVVVSNDRGIQRLIGGTGAKFLKSDDFLKAAPKSQPPPPAANKEVRDDITDEFKKKWLE